MKKRLHTLCLAVFAACWLLVGCSRDDKTPLASELDEPYYRQGQQLTKQGRYQEALTAYLKVIAKRNEDAPESHLEAGAIYVRYIRNYVEAIHHFNRYLALQPNSRQAALVRQQIDGAKREFARTLPAQPAEIADDRADLQAQIARLQQENDHLKSELAGSRGGSPVTSLAVAPETSAASNPASARRTPELEQAQPESPITLAPAPLTGASSAAPAVSLANPPATRSAPIRPPTRPTNTPTTASTGGRRHVVAGKESLWSIARKYYGPSPSAAKVQGILDANRAVLPDATALKPGMEIRIP